MCASTNGNDREVQARLDIAIEAAQEAGMRTLHYFNTERYDTETKGDGTPVTTADREAEETIRGFIANHFPDDGVLGEEFGDLAGASGYRWIIDPIDGTRSFIHGVPLYGTLIGIEKENEALAGVVRMPALDEMVYARRGHGAWHAVCDKRPGPAQVSCVDDPKKAMLSMTSIDYFRDHSTEKLFVELSRSFGVTRGWCDCYGHVLLATGRSDVVVEPILSPWDIAAVIPIVIEAGGRYTDWNGDVTAHTPHGISSNGLLHDYTLGLVR